MQFCFLEGRTGPRQLNSGKKKLQPLSLGHQRTKQIERVPTMNLEVHHMIRHLSLTYQTGEVEVLNQQFFRGSNFGLITPNIYRSSLLVHRLWPWQRFWQNQSQLFHRLLHLCLNLERLASTKRTWPPHLKRGKVRDQERISQPLSLGQKYKSEPGDGTNNQAKFELYY